MLFRSVGKLHGEVVRVLGLPDIRERFLGLGIEPVSMAPEPFGNYIRSEITKWARAWEARGWRKKDGEIKNLELVQEAYALVQQRPGVKLQWVKAHDGTRWNEYVDALATQARAGR